MKFGLMFANAGPFAYPESFENLVKTADEVGIESIWSVEHVVVPVGYKSVYPYSPDGRMPGPESVPIPDPIVPLAYAAAITKNLRLGTGVVILPQRHPLYVAKQMATLDVLSHGRAMLGVGIGWMEEEFAAVGVPFSERAKRTEESIKAIRSLWKDEPQAFEGKFFNWPPVESHPKPVQRGGVPIIVGGHAKGAARRAARCGDGFFPGRSDHESLAALLDEMRTECNRIGRDPKSVEITAGTPVTDLDSVRRYGDLGVSRMIIPPPAFDPEGVKKGLEEFASKVLAKL
jgi:probable F420-dependent oxidoreductase